MTSDRHANYWAANLRLLAGLLFVGFAVSCGCGILLAEPLNAIRLGRYPLGFWFAQQGAIYCFVALAFLYAVLMSWLDRKYRTVDESPAGSAP